MESIKKIFNPNKYLNITNFFDDTYFSVIGLDTLQLGPNPHKILHNSGYIECYFNDKNKELLIKYEKKDSLIAFLVMVIKILGANEPITKITIGDHTNIEIKNILEPTPETLFNMFFDFIVYNTEISVQFESEDDYTYSQIVLVYTTEKYHYKTHNLLVELDRWEHLK